MADRSSSAEREPPIREGDARLPWWVWVAIAAWLVYAFLIAPFNWFSPVGG